MNILLAEHTDPQEKYTRIVGVFTNELALEKFKSDYLKLFSATSKITFTVIDNVKQNHIITEGLYVGN